jgi:lantibiotic modifying enzyme
METKAHAARATLAAATRIGETLCATAYWDERRTHCAWMGFADVGPPAQGNETTAFAAVDANLYSGTAGVALFLAELYALTRGPLFGETSLAALKRSVHLLKSTNARAAPLSLFSGHMGAAYVASRLIDIGLGEDLEGELDWLVARVLEGLGGPHLLDLVSGNAGAIPVLLTLSRRKGLERCFDAARACGDELCATAARQDGLCSWEATRASGFDAPALTGFSHGASGIALALLELHARTGSAPFLETARGAFAYEDTFFSRGRGNWLDLRHPYVRNGDDVEGSAQATWCHGAPGIGLARLRAMSLDRESEDEHLKTARVALNTTTAAIEDALGTSRSDATLCHGLAGLSEVVHIFGELLGDESCRNLAADTALKLVELYGREGDWPSGTSSGKHNPTLMLGSAGVGHHLLRLHAPGRVPPVLLFTGGGLSS